MRDEIKNYLKSIFNKYNDNEQFSYGIDKAIGELQPFVLFNKEKNIYVSFSESGRQTKFSDDITDLLEDDMLEYLAHIHQNKNINKHNLSLDRIMRIAVASFYIYSTTSSFNGIQLEPYSYSVVQEYIESRFRIKLRHYLIYNIINTKLLDRLMFNHEKNANMKLDFTPDDRAVSLVDELFTSNNLDMKYKNYFYMSLKRYMSTEFRIPTLYCSEIKQGVVKLFLQINLVKK